ncbi:putative ribonuclease H-like domain-containing protein, partial [Tanacetum coccineum]
TVEEILARERERKAMTTLLMALPEDHLAKFHKMTDAKEISTNDVSTAYGVSNPSGHNSQYEQTSSYSLLVNQSSCPQLDHEDLEQLNEFDLEEMDLKWQVAMILIRMKKTKGNQDNRRKDAWNSGNKDVRRSEAQKEKEDLKAKVEKWHNYSKNLGKLLNTQMSANDKFGLGYGDHRYDGILSYENEVLQSVFLNKESVLEKQPLYDSVETHESLPERPVNEPKVVNQPKVRSDAPIIEEYESDNEDEHVPQPTKEQEQPSFASTNKQVKTPRETVKNQFTHSKNPTVDKKGLGYGFTARACFVCGSLSHLIRDCDFHEKRMAKQAELNNSMRMKSSQREIRPIWNNVQRVNHKNQFVPTAVLTRTGKIPVNTARASGTNKVSTARHDFNRQAVLTNAAMKVNTVKPIVNRVRPANLVLLGGKGKLLLSPQQVVIGDKKDITGKISPNTIVDQDYPHRTLKHKGIIDSGCSRHMTGNKAYLAAYQDFNGGPVAFGGSKGSENQANKHAGPQEANHKAGTKDNIDAGDSKKEDESAQDYFVLPIWSSYSSTPPICVLGRNLPQKEKNEDLLLQAGAAKASSTNIVNTVSTLVSTASPYDGLSFPDPTNPDQDGSEIPTLEDIYKNPTDVQKQSKVSSKRLLEPHKISEALEDESWVDVMQDELLQFKIQKVWILVDLPYGKKAIGTKWVYRNKKDMRGVVVRNKARLVAQGHRQEEGIDYDEVFAPVARIEAIGIFLAFSSYMGFIVYQIDVKSAFLYGKINEEEIHSRRLLVSWQEETFSWQWQKQTIVATSTTEAEYVAAANCCGQVLWIQNQMLDYGFNFMNTKIYIDNESTICIVKNPVYHSKTKHIAIRHHFIRDAYEKKLIQVLKIHTDDNVADLLTKAFDVSRFQFLVCAEAFLTISDEFQEVNWVFKSHWEEIKTVLKYITAKVAGKPVSISEASIRSDLLFYDADGIDSLPNQAIFDAIQLMGYEGDLTLVNVPVPLDHFPVNALTSKVFSCMIKKGKHFSGKVTPLFASMLVQSTEDEGATSERPSEPQPTPFPPHPSEANIEPQSDPSPRPSPTPYIPDSIPEVSGGNQGGQSSSDRSLLGTEGGMTLQGIYDLCISLCTQVTDQAKEIKHLKTQIKKLKKQVQTLLYPHHRALACNSVSLERQRLAGKKILKSNWLAKDFVFSLYRTGEERKEGTEDAVSTDKEKVSTDRSKDSTDKEKEGTDKEKDSTVSLDEGTDDRTKARSATSTTPTTTPTMFGDDETIAQVLLNMSQAKAVSREKEKGVDLKDVEETERPRPTST